MPTPTVLIATWRDGLFTVTGDSIRHEFAGRTVCGLTRDRGGGALAILDRRSVGRLTAAGDWRTVADVDTSLACCLEVDGAIYAGTEDARVLRIDARGQSVELDGFNAVPGREKWYAGAALIDGKLIGPPLGIRSMSATRDGAVLLVNVHVGGIPRSLDGGRTWQPTLDIELDVHEVVAHPSRPELVAAAAAAGLCVSHDAGATWTVEQEGLHAAYCSAVAFAGDELLVAASAGHFAAEGAVYHRPIEGNPPLRLLDGGFPERISGICDTDCIDVAGSKVALADRAGNLYCSEDFGRTWTCRSTGARSPSAVALI
ncbi:MAG TPA: hypothetical protein VGI35_03445 [Steroidobacteraceae bacterium]